MSTDVTTTSNGMYLDGDYENSSSADNSPHTAIANVVSVLDGRTVTAKTVMTLESSASRIVPSGNVTFKAGSGLVLLDDMKDSMKNQTLIFDVDYESTGDGTLTVVVGKGIESNDCDMLITAWNTDCG